MVEVEQEVAEANEDVTVFRRRRQITHSPVHITDYMDPHDFGSVSESAATRETLDWQRTVTRIRKPGRAIVPLADPLGSSKDDSTVALRDLSLISVH